MIFKLKYVMWIIDINYIWKIMYYGLFDFIIENKE